MCSRLLCSFIISAVLFNRLSVATDPRCPEALGLFPDPTSCSRYISCWGGRAFILSCPKKFVFNPQTNACERGIHCFDINNFNAPNSGEFVRLDGSQNQGSGEVRLKHEGKWAPITARSFDEISAVLFCRRLGYESFTTWFTVEIADEQNVQLVDVKCSPEDVTVEQCSVTPCLSCSGNEPTASLRCQVPLSSRCPQGSKLWQRWGESCYLTNFELSLNREEAFNYCNNIQSNLVTIDSQLEHEFIASLIRSHADSQASEFYTDGAGVVLAGNGGILWAWQSSRNPLKYKKWWPGWNFKHQKSLESDLLSPLPTPSCLILKRHYKKPVLNSTIEIFGSSGNDKNSVEIQDADFPFFYVGDCSTERFFVCESPLTDFGCIIEKGVSYNGTANISVSSKVCLKWTDPNINSLAESGSHARQVRPEDSFDSSLIGDHNFCRNPNFSSRPWCFVNFEVAESCDIPKCNTSVTPPFLSNVKLNLSKLEHNEQMLLEKEELLRDQSYATPSPEHNPRSNKSIVKFGSLESNLKLRENEQESVQGRLEAENVDIDLLFLNKRISSLFSQNSKSPDFAQLISKIFQIRNPRLLNDTETNLDVSPDFIQTISDKTKCKENEYTCENSNECIKQTEVCDGSRQCIKGDDEHSCKRFLKQVDSRKFSTLIERDLIQSLYREDIGVCAKRCLDDFRCKGFLYDEQKRECGMSRLTIGESGLKPSSNEHFYEVRSRKRFCGSKFRCQNSKCVPKSSVCDGRNDCVDNSDESKCLKPIEHKLRLVGGSHDSEGNVQLKIEGKWGHICDDKFSWNEADVVCKELGFNFAQKFTRNNHFGVTNIELLRSTPKYWFSGLSCVGTEKSLLECPSSGLGHHECGPTEIAGVICEKDKTLTYNSTCFAKFNCEKNSSYCISRYRVCNNEVDCHDHSDERAELCEDLGVVRLLSTKGSPGVAMGTLHVKKNNEWGTVCDDNFDDVHAKVVCRSLGYDTTWATAYPKAYFGRGSGGVLIDEPGCLGSEPHLGACTNITWGPGNCDHSEDVGVFCSDKEKLRLSDGRRPHEGRVEILLNGVWGTICDDDFDDYDAKVVCRVLGYPGGGIYHKRAHFGKGSGPVWLENMDCLGNETELNQCQRTSPGTSACSHSEDVSVTCFKLPPKPLERSLYKKLPLECGRPLSGLAFIFGSVAKIIGGKKVSRFDSPWLVSLQLTENGVQKHNCGGVVISEDLILTAAHCFRTHSKEEYVARVGDYDLFSQEVSEEDFLIEKLFVHDDFDTRVEFNNDVALLKISRKNGKGINLSNSVQPICLPPPNSDHRYLKNCRIIGWGTLDERSEPIPQRHPRAGEVEMYPMGRCLGQYKYGRHEVTSGMFCAGQMDGSVDTCTGDSGGPLTCFVNGKHVLYGITSWGKGCGRVGQPGMYTKITKYLRWLSRIVT